MGNATAGLMVVIPWTQEDARLVSLRIARSSFRLCSVGQKTSGILNGRYHQPLGSMIIRSWLSMRAAFKGVEVPTTRPCCDRFARSTLSCEPPEMVKSGRESEQHCW